MRQVSRMKKKTVVITALCLVLISMFLTGCLKKGSGRGSNAPDSGGSIGSGDADNGVDMYEGQIDEEEQDYSLKVIEMDKQEQDEALGKLYAFMESCRDIYERRISAGDRRPESGGHAVDGTVDTGGADEDALHEMVKTGGANGLSVTCGNRDYNLTNYGQVDQALRDALAGKDAKTEIYQVTTALVFRYYHLAFSDNELVVTSVGAIFGEGMEPALQQLEKIRAYRWEYTEKGWLIWEKALSRNQEMDMHIFCRVLPLEEQCRDIAREYIVPVSYFCNNLFLTDWDMSCMEKIEFNDLYEFLYAKETGKRPDEETYRDGIPKQEFEDIIGRYFDIPAGRLEQFARYDSGTGRYPWIPIGIPNRVRQLQPSFPEVVRCTENGDGTVTAFVEAVSTEEGLDCYYAHEVALRRREDGRYLYAGNRVDREHSFCVPAYRARREFEGTKTE